MVLWRKELRRMLNFNVPLPWKTASQKSIIDATASATELTCHRIKQNCLNRAANPGWISSNYTFSIPLLLMNFGKGMKNMFFGYSCCDWETTENLQLEQINFLFLFHISKNEMDTICSCFSHRKVDPSFMSDDMFLSDPCCKSIRLTVGILCTCNHFTFWNIYDVSSIWGHKIWKFLYQL